MRKKAHSLHKLIYILSVIVLVLGTQACSQGTQGFNEEPPPGEGPPPEEFTEGEPPPEGEEPPPGEVFIEFNAERPNLMPGECTMLFWHTEGGFSAFLNGEPVEPSGEREECLDESRRFVLEVDTGGRMEMREVEVMVEGEPGQEPSPEEPPMEEPQPEPAQPEPQQPQPQQPAPQVNPPTQAPQPSNQCQTNFRTDIAITDIYAGNLPTGQVHIRITNKGPCTLQNVKDDVYCFVDKIDLNTKKISYDAATVSVVYNMAPGVQQTFPPGITLDTNVFRYTVTCNLQPGNFKDTNTNNNSHTEQVP